MGQRLGRAVLLPDATPLAELPVEWIVERWGSFRENHPDGQGLGVLIDARDFVDLLLPLHERIYFNYRGGKMTEEQRQEKLFEFKSELNKSAALFTRATSGVSSLQDANSTSIETSSEEARDTTASGGSSVAHINVKEAVISLLLMSSSAAPTKVAAMLQVLFDGAVVANSTEIDLVLGVVLRATLRIDALPEFSFRAVDDLAVQLTDRLYRAASGRKRVYDFQVSEICALLVRDAVFNSWIHYYTRSTHWVEDAPPPVHTYWKSQLENEVNRATSVGFEAVMERIRELDDVVTRQRHRNAAHILRLRDHIVTKRAENDALAKKISTTRAELNMQMPKEERVTRSDAATKWHYETIRNERLIAKWTEEIKEVQRAATQKHTPLYRVMAQYNNYVGQIEKLNEQHQFQRAVNCPRDYLRLNVALSDAEARRGVDTDGDVPHPLDEYEPPTNAMPNGKMEIEWIYGFRGNDVRHNLAYLRTEEVIYTVATTVVIYDRKANLQRFMSFHSQDVVSLAVHPDGVTVATGEDGADSPKIIVWKSEFVGTQCPSTLNILRGAHTHPISFLAFSPGDGKLLLSVALDPWHTIKVFDWAAGSVIFSAASDHRQVFGALWKNPDEFVTFGHSHIYFWRQAAHGTAAAAAAQVVIVRAPAGTKSDDSARVAGGVKDIGVTRAYDAETSLGTTFTKFHGLLARGAVIQRFTSATVLGGAGVDASAGHYLVTGAANGRLCLWFERHCLFDVFGHYDQVTVVRSNPLGDRVFSACAVGKIVIWAVVVKQGRPTAMENIGSLDLVSFGSFNPVVQSLDFRVVPAEQSEQSANPAQSTVKRQDDALSQQPTTKQHNKTNPISAVDDGSDLILLVGTAGCEVYEISAASGLDINSRPLVVTHRGDDIVALCSRARIACTGGYDGILRFVNLDKHCVVNSVDLGAEVSCVALSPNFPLAVAGIGVHVNPRPGGREGAFYVISTDDMSCKYLGRDSSGCPRAVQFSPKGGQFVIASDDGSIYVYYVEYRKTHRDYKVWLRAQVDFGAGPCVHVDFSADAKFLQVEVRADSSPTAAASLRYINFQQQDLAISGEASAIWGRDIDMHTQWATWSCTCGWAVETVAPRYADLTALSRSIGGEIFATTDQYGRLILVHAPSLSPRPTRVMGFVHGSRATNVVCTDDGFNILTVGGNDRCLVQWRLDLDVIDADMVSAVERSKILEQEIIQQKQKLRSVRAALKLSLKPLIEERQFVQAKVNSWRQRIKRTMEPLEKYKGKDLVLGNLLKAQQRELDRWMGPLSSVRKRIKSIQDMYTKEGSDIFNISHHIETLKRELQFEIGLMAKTRKNDLGVAAAALAISNSKSSAGTQQRAETASTAGTSLSSSKRASMADAMREAVSESDSEEDLDRDAWESLPQRSFRVVDEEGTAVPPPSGQCSVRMTWIYGSNGTTGETVAYGASSNDVIYTAARFPVLLRKSMWHQDYLLEHAQPISCLTVHAKTKMMATGQRGGPGFGGLGGVIYVFDLSEAKRGEGTMFFGRASEPVRELSGFHSHGIAKVKFSRSGALLLSLGAVNNRMAVYDWRSHTVIATVEGGSLPVLDVAFAADANLFLQCGVESIKFHRFHGRNVESQKAVLGAAGVLQTFSCVTCFGNFPIVGTEDGNLYQFGSVEPDSDEPVGLKTGKRGNVSPLAGSRQLRAVIPAHEGAVTALYACEAGLISGGADCKVIQWSSSFKQARVFDLLRIRAGRGSVALAAARAGVEVPVVVTSVCWDGVSPQVLVGLSDGEVREVWQTPVGKTMDVNGGVLVDANSPRSRGSGGGAGSEFFRKAAIKLATEAMTQAKQKIPRGGIGHRMRVATGDRGPIEDVAAGIAVHPNRLQFVCVREALLHIFDCPTRRTLFVQHLERPGYCCSFSPDGRAVVVGVQGATIPPSDMTNEVHTLFVYGLPSGSDEKVAVPLSSGLSDTASQFSATSAHAIVPGSAVVEAPNSLFRLHSWRHADRNSASSITVVRFSPDAKTLLVGTDLGHLLSYDARPGNNYHLLCKVKRTSLGYITGMDFSTCSGYVRVADSAGTIAYLHLYRPTVIYVVRAARLPVDDIKWASSTCAMEDLYNDPDVEDKADPDDPFVPSRYVEVAAVADFSSIDNDDKQGESSSLVESNGKGMSPTDTLKMAKRAKTAQRKRQDKVNARRRSRRAALPPDVLVGAHANGNISVLTTRNESIFCRWDFAACTASFGGHASRLLDLVVTSPDIASGVVDTRHQNESLMPPRHVMTISKVHHCIIQWSISPRSPPVLLQRDPEKRGNDTDSSEILPLEVERNAGGTASWLSVKSVHEERLATNADADEVDVVEFSAKLIDTAFLSPRRFNTYADLEWVFGQPKGSNNSVQIGAASTFVYSVDNNILHLRLTDLDKRVKALSYTNSTITQSALSDDLNFLLTVELQMDAEVLGRFAERHGQPIVRIYNVRDASLRSSIRPNSKGPLISVAMSPSAAHVAIISGDCFHTLTVWQRRHLDWTGGAFIVARQLVGNQFTPNKLLYTPWHDLPLFLMQSAKNSARPHNGPSGSRPGTTPSHLRDHHAEHASTLTGRPQRDEADGVVCWQFWTYGRQNLSIVHSTIVPQSEDDSTTASMAPIQDHERVFVVKAIGHNHAHAPHFAFDTWTCAASFHDVLIIGTTNGALLSLSLDAVHTRSVAEVVLRGQIAEVNNRRDSPTERHPMFDSAVVALSESNQGWLVIGDLHGSVRVLDAQLGEVVHFSISDGSPSVPIARLSYDHSAIAPQDFRAAKVSLNDPRREEQRQESSTCAVPQHPESSTLLPIGGVAVALQDGSAKFWSPSSDAVIEVLPSALPQTVFCIAAHPLDPDIAVYGGRDELGVWNLQTKRLVAKCATPGKVSKIHWTKGFGIIAAVARTAKSPLGAMSSSSTNRMEPFDTSKRSSASDSSNILVYQLKNISLGSTPNPEVPVSKAQLKHQLQLEHSACSAGLKGGGNVHFLRADDQMNVIFVAIEDTVEVFRRSQAMQMEVLSICTMPKQLHPVSMYTEHQSNSLHLLLSNESRCVFDILSGHIMERKLQPLPPTKPRKAPRTGVAVPNEKIITDDGSPADESSEDGGENNEDDDGSGWVESWICIRFPGIDLALMQMQRPVPIPPAWDVEAVAAARADADRAAAAGEVVMPPLDPTWHRIMSQKVKETKEVRAIKKRLQTYRNLFRKMDVDGGGGVDFDELKDFCLRMFGETNDELLRMMFKDADEDGSGEIELDEFVHILKKMDYDDEVLAMDSEEADILEEAGIEANIGTVEVQGESEFADACLNCDCSRVLVVNANCTSFKSWLVHSFEREFKRRTNRSIN